MLYIILSDSNFLSPTIASVVRRIMLSVSLKILQIVLNPTRYIRYRIRVFDVPIFLSLFKHAFDWIFSRSYLSVSYYYRSRVVYVTIVRLFAGSLVSKDIGYVTRRFEKTYAPRPKPAMTDDDGREITSNTRFSKLELDARRDAFSIEMLFRVC